MLQAINANEITALYDTIDTAGSQPAIRDAAIALGAIYPSLPSDHPDYATAEVAFKNIAIAQGRIAETPESELTARAYPGKGRCPCGAGFLRAHHHDLPHEAHIRTYEDYLAALRDSAERRALYWQDGDIAHDTP